MAKKPSTAVAKAGAAKGAVAVSEDMANLPAYMQKHVGAGTENIGREDLEIPRVKLIQGLSPELQEWDKLRPGMFFHTANEEMFTSIRAVPVYMDKRYILWRPREMGGGILARADDGVHWSPADGSFEVKLDKKDGGHKVTWKIARTVQQSGLANWGTLNPQDKDSPPAATLMYSYVLAFPDHPELLPAVLTFQRSSIRAGRKFNTKLKTVRAPMYGLVFEFSSFDDTNSNGQDFKNVRVQGVGVLQDERLFNEYAALHQGFKDSGLQIKDIEGAQDETPEGGAEDADPGETTDAKTGKARARF